jgi:hypothetical protein
MTIEKRVPPVYFYHELLDEAVRPFADVPGHLVVSEHWHSPDWFFVLRRQGGEFVKAMLPANGRNQSPRDLMGVIREFLRTTLAGDAPSQKAY